MVYLLVLFAISSSLRAPVVEIEVGSTPRQIVVVATLDSTTANALPNGRLERNVGAKLLRLSLSGSAKKVGPAIFGSYQHRGRKLRFSPRFNLVAGESYVATLTLGNGDQHHLRYVVPVKYTRPAPVVIAVYPTADQLPANHLKFYLHFSEPMREGRDIFEKIQLFDGAGTKVIGPWRRQELWNENATRFTLWIHPGRIKKGLALRKEEGSVLIPGGKYTLRIESSLPGSDGQTLRKSYEKKFRVGKSDKTRPVPSGWDLVAPPVGSRDLLRVNFGEPLDCALAQRCLEVYDGSNRPISGKVSLQHGETTWTFKPASPWENEIYRLRVDPELEDLSGNTPARVFETDLNEARPRKMVTILRFQPTGK